jgi:hypothetical protein
MRYAALVGAGGSVEVSPMDEVVYAGVTVVSVSVQALGKRRIRRGRVGDARTHQLDVAWELAI